MSSTKEGMAVPDVAAVNSYAIAVSCESSLTDNDSRPPSRSGPLPTSVSPQIAKIVAAELCNVFSVLCVRCLSESGWELQVASSRSHKNVLPPGVNEPLAAKRGCLAASSRKDERARK